MIIKGHERESISFIDKFNAVGNFTYDIYCHVKMIFEKKRIKSNHLKPKYYDYNGGYWNVNICSGCDLVGMYEDLHQANACPQCGSEIIRHGSAIWEKVNGLFMWKK